MSYQLRFRFHSLVALGILFGSMLTTTVCAVEDELNAEKQVWSGTLDTPTAALRIRFELQKKADGTFEGSLVSPDQGNTRLPIQSASFTGNEFQLELRKPRASYQGTVDAAGKTMTGTWKQGSAEFPLKMSRGELAETDGISKGIWAGTIQAGIQLKVQVRLVENPTTKKTDAYFDSLSQGVRGLKATLTQENGTLIVEVPAVKGRFEGKLRDDGTKAKGLWSQGLIKLPLELAKTDVAEEAIEIKRPQHPQPPFDYQVEQVTFASQESGVTLAGTLTLPKSDDKQTFMAAVLISGSGPQDRDETIMGHKPFLVIADHLTRKGIAVLRFDDRGTGDSTGDHNTATTEHFADDVRGAVAFLRKHPAIDPSRVGLIGHSEGGLIGPMVSAKDSQIAFLVLLAGPGVNGEQIILKQSAAIARTSGETDAAIALQQQQLPELIEAIKQGKTDEEIRELVSEFAKAVKDQAAQDGDDSAPSGEDLESMLATGFERMQTPWFRFFLTYEPLPALKSTTCPILSLIGEKDIQVDPQQNRGPLEEAIRAAGHPKSASHELPGLNHLFQECETGGLNEYSVIEQTFAPVALQHMSDWLHSLDAK